MLREIIPTLNIDARDNIGWPTKGFYFNGLADIANFGFGSQVQYNNFIGNMMVYFPIYKK